jgi:hypothetical protein
VLVVEFVRRRWKSRAGKKITVVRLEVRMREARMKKARVGEKEGKPNEPCDPHYIGETERSMGVGSKNFKSYL